MMCKWSLLRFDYNWSRRETQPDASADNRKSLIGFLSIFRAFVFTCDLGESVNSTLAHWVQDSSRFGFKTFASWLCVVSDEQGTAECWRKAPAWFAFRAVFTALDKNDKLECLRENLIISSLTGLDLIICTSKSPASPFSADYSVPEG